MKRFALAALLASSMAHAAPETTPLSLSEVVRSARAHPLALQAAAESGAARARQLQAEGALDLLVKAGAQHAPSGAYAESAAFIGVEQPTTLHGLRLHGSYRNGVSFPVYNGERVTSRHGEAALELVLPVLRDGAIDRARFSRVEARVLEQQAQLAERDRLIQLTAAASAAWYRWVAQGQRLTIAKDLAAFAEARAAFVRQQADSGQVARIQAVDTDRLVATRNAQVVAEDLKLQERALALGLFVRDDLGRPQPPHASRLPNALPTARSLPPSALAQAQARALERPELGVLELSLRLLRQELGFAENQRLPRVDLRVRGSRDFGVPRAYAPFAASSNATTVMAVVALETPVQQRAARGRIEALRQSLAALTQRTRFARDTALTEVRQAWLTLEATRAQHVLLAEARSAAERLASAERELWIAGQSSLLTVNLREDAAASAALLEVDALLAHHEAVVRFIASSANGEQAQFASQ